MTLPCMHTPLDLRKCYLVLAYASLQDPATGMSALMKAADERKKEAVELLLQAGCPWNLLDNDGYCAGGWCVFDPAVTL